MLTNLFRSLASITLNALRPNTIGTQAYSAPKNKGDSTTCWCASAFAVKGKPDVYTVEEGTGYFSVFLPNQYCPRDDQFSHGEMGFNEALRKLDSLQQQKIQLGWTTTPDSRTGFGARLETVASQYNVVLSTQSHGRNSMVPEKALA